MRKNIVVHKCPICHETFYNYDAKYHHLRTLHGRRDEIIDILKKAAGVKLPEVYFRSAIETNLLDEDLWAGGTAHTFHDRFEEDLML